LFAVGSAKEGKELEMKNMRGEENTLLTSLPSSNEKVRLRYRKERREKTRVCGFSLSLSFSLFLSLSPPREEKYLA